MNSFTLGPFAIDPPGTLAPRDAGQRPALRFAWRGRPCEAELGTGEVRISAIAARMPSTAGRTAGRAGALAALAALPPLMPEGWTMRLLPDHRISLESAEPLAAPTTAVGLVTRLVRFALALDPYLDRLEAAGAEAPGSART